MNDVTSFHKLNVTDTCSLWNLMASKLLYVRSREAGVSLCCTQFVVYECLFKPGQPRPEREELQRRLRPKLDDGSISSHAIDIEDLQDVDILRNRKRLSIGELSSIVFARKTGQALLTDDAGAQKLARAVLNQGHLQTVPHLFGWLYFNSLLSDGDKDHISAELTALARGLNPHLDRYHTEAQRCRAVANQAATMLHQSRPEGG
jgi:hypothetical protein